MATIKDVATRAGVSISTVSYALSGVRSISPEKKSLIEAAMNELDYKPHAIARSLASKHTKIIALLFSAVERGLGLSELTLIMKAAKTATKAGYHLVLWSLQTNDTQELRELILQELVDGVLLMEVHNNDPRISLLYEKKIPFFLFGRDESYSENFVDIDFSATMEAALTYLIRLGHHTICFLNQSEKTLKSGYGPVVRTHESFIALSKSLHIQGYEKFCEPNAKTGLEVVQGLLTETPDITAFIVMNDNIISSVIKGIEENDFRIPEDKSIVALFSSASLASLFIPPITTFEMDGGLMMETAIGQLISKIEKKETEKKQQLIPCKLIERGSSGSIGGKQV